MINISPFVLDQTIPKPLDHFESNSKHIISFVQYVFLKIRILKEHSHNTINSHKIFSHSLISSNIQAVSNIPDTS
jgi:hypothetical protein